MAFNFEVIFYIGLFLSILILCITSFYVKDYAFILDRPFDFFMELFFISIVPALLMVFIFAKTRKLTTSETQVWFFTVLLKLMIFHILFQLSGIYSYTFGNR